MGAKQVIMQQGDGLDTLKQLLDSLQNPKIISDANETYRKEIALTEAEEKRATEGRAVIAQYDAISLDIATREQAIKDAITAHEKEVSDFESLKQSETDRLSDWEGRLKIVEDAQLAVTNSQATERAALVSERDAMNLKNENDRKQIDSDKTVNDKASQENSKRSDELDAATLELSKRLQSVKLREQAADLME